MKNSELFEKVESLQNLLISRATGGEAHDKIYKQLRQELLYDSYLKDKLPRFVRTCYDLDQFWNFIKYKYKTYRERREYIWQEFKPILEFLEGENIEFSKSIFLSHSSKDKFFVRNLAEHLTNNGIKVWLDEAELNIGDSLTEKIAEAIETTDYVGVVLSHNSINSEWVQKELQIALQKEIKGRNVVVLPILIEKVEIPAFLRDKWYADFTNPENFDNELAKLLRTLGGHTRAKREPAKKETSEKVGLKKPFEQLTLTERKLTTFEDIKIVEIDDTKSYKPDPKKLLYNIYLKLSSSPPLEWQEIFEAERRFPRHTMWRKAWIEGDYIVIHCVPDEIEEYHAKDLKQDVENTNKKYRQFLMEESLKEAKKVEQEKSEKDKLKILKERVKF